MTYDDTVKARKDHLVPGMVTYYKKPLLIDQVMPVILIP